MKSNDDRLWSVEPVERAARLCSFWRRIPGDQQAEDVLAADALVLPGVGAFKDGMAGLEKLGLIEPITPESRRRHAAAGHLPGHADVV